MFRQKTQLIRQKPTKAGFSLLEMLISLAIFGIIMVSFVSLPIKAMQKNDSLQDQATSIQEVHQIFMENLKKDLGKAKHFLPLSFSNPENPQLFNAKKQLFIAYYDPKRRQTSQVGYMLLTDHVDETKYELFRTEIPNTSVTDMIAYQAQEPNLTLWQKAGLSNKKESIKLGTKSEQSSIYFQYCTGLDCNDTILPKQANGVRIIAKNNQHAEEVPIYVTLNKTETQLPALYFRLGSDLNAQTASLGPYAFPITINSQSSSNLALRDINATTGRRMALPSETGTLPITLGDPAYNPRTGDVIWVGQSDTSIPAARKTFYVLKWQARTIAYPGYETTSSSSTNSLSGFNENNSDNPFPITLNSNSPGYLGSAFRFVSVTQDEEGYIYVLATRPAVTGGATFQANILRFSPEGGFISQSNISGTPGRGDLISEAYGVAYTPSSPDEVHVLVKVITPTTGAANYYVRTYNKFDNHTNANFVSHTAQSPLLNDARMSDTFFTDSTPTGLEIIPGKNQYIISGNTSTGPLASTCQFVSFPINTPDTTGDTNFGKPIDRGFLLSKVKTLSASTVNNLKSCNGIAIDPINDALITPYQTGNATNQDQNIAYIGLNTSLQRNY